MNIATDDHRYLISAPWGDSAYADTRDSALTARRRIAQDARDNGHPGARTEDVFVIDRGFPIAPLESAA